MTVLEMIYFDFIVWFNQSISFFFSFLFGFNLVDFCQFFLDLFLSLFRWFIKIFDITCSLISKKACHFFFGKIIDSECSLIWRIWSFDNSWLIVHEINLNSSPSFYDNRLNSHWENEVDDLKGGKEDISFESELEDLSDRELYLTFLFIVFESNLEIIFFC